MRFATLPDGATLAYDDYYFGPPWLKPETIILVHGFSKNRRFYYGWIAKLAERFRVIRVDQRGHGDSSAVPQGFQMALRPFSDDLAAFTKAIGITRAHYVMAEFTSVVGIDFANAYPELIQTLTLPGFAFRYVGSPVDRHEWVRLAEEEGAAAWAKATNRFRLPENADPAMREWYIGEQSRMPGWFLGALFRFNMHLDMTAHLPGMKVPCLLIAGSAAKQGTLETIREAQGLIPDCDVTVLDGLPYNVMSADPERCVAATIAFIDKIAARAGGAA